MHPLAYVASGVLDSRVSVHVAELPEAEPVAVARGIREAVDHDGMRAAVEYFAHSAIQLVVGDRGPVERLLVGDWGDFSGGFRVVGRWGVRGGRRVGEFGAGGGWKPRARVGDVVGHGRFGGPLER